MTLKNPSVIVLETREQAARSSLTTGSKRYYRYYVKGSKESDFGLSFVSPVASQVSAFLDLGICMTSPAASAPTGRRFLPPMGLFQSKGQQLDATTASNAAQLTNEILESFGKEFAKFYSHCLVNTFDVNKQSLLAKKKLRGRLEEPPPPHCVVKKGTLTKKGLINSSPRSRHFVAYNQKDNYRVDYYESDNGMRKGSIDCCGYYLRLMDKRENELYGPNGLKLVPYDVTRR